MCLVLIWYLEGYRYSDAGYEYVPPSNNYTLKYTTSQLNELLSHFPNEPLSNREVNQIFQKYKPSTSKGIDVGLTLTSKSFLQDERENFIVEGPIVISKRTGLMWMRCSSQYFYADGECKIKASDYSFESTINLLNNKAMYGYNDWRIANVREVADILMDGWDQLTPVVALNVSAPYNVIFDGENDEFMERHFLSTSSQARISDRYKGAFFVRGGGAN
jgi:hypothetical protein